MAAEQAPWVPASTWRCDKCNMHLPFENFATIQGAVELHKAQHTIVDLQATLADCGERVKELYRTNSILSMQAVDFANHGLRSVVQ